MKTIQFRFFIPVFVMLFSVACLANAQNWVTHTDHDHHFTVQMPELPQDAYKEVPGGFKITTYATSAACTYMVKLHDMHTAPKNGTTMAKKTVNDMVAKLGGKVIAEEEWKHKNAVGTKATIDVPDKGEGKPQMKVIMHVIVVGNTQYQLVTMGPLELFEDAVVEHFLSTFKFI